MVVPKVVVPKAVVASEGGHVVVHLVVQDDDVIGVVAG